MFDPQTTPGLPDNGELSWLVQPLDLTRDGAQQARSRRHRCAPTYDQVVEARRIAARVVKLYGDDYLPFFEALDALVVSISKRDQVRQSALQFAGT